MAALDLEAEYNNRQRVPAHPQINARWSAASAACRQVANADYDQPYGPKERQRYDLFRAGDAKAPLAVYIHGGYWQRGDRKDYSFLAKELNTAGIDVALPSYSLCPAVSVMDIVGELQVCLAAIWRKTGKYPVVAGHSAGGHLTAAMLATDWSNVAGVPADLVRAGVAISGVFDLVPLIPTSINELVGFDDASARAASPLLWPAPASARTLVAAVGGNESSEFLRQSREIAQAWARAGLKTEYLVVPGTDHFTVVDELTKPASPLFAAVATLARQVNVG
jgi:arylformamidase